MKIELLEAATPYIRYWDTAVDGGAYKGEWTYPLSTKFKTVYAFEPQKVYAEMLEITHIPNVIVVNAALMDQPGMGIFVVPPRDPRKPATDRSTTVLRGRGAVKIVRLDDYPISNCALIKLNVEGCEHLVLEGARHILENDGPVIIMEEAHPKKLPDPYKKSSRQSRRFLVTMGYVLAGEYGHDSIWRRK